MKTSLPLLLLIPGLLIAAVNTPSLPPDMQQARYAEVRTRIAALFEHRDTPPPEIEYADNPFLIGAVRPPSSHTPEVIPIVDESAETRLREVVSGLRISGIAQLSGVDFVVINLQPRKVGDIISVPRQGVSVRVRVEAIAPGEVTFSLDGATLSRRF